MDDRSDEVLAVAILFFILCWITVSLRTYCRWRVIHSFGVDDTLLVVLLVRSPFHPAGIMGKANTITGYLHSISLVTISSLEVWDRETRDRHIC
jgi:hypothetical protein